LAIVALSSPDPGIYSAFNSNSSAAYRAANADVASLVSSDSSYYSANLCSAYLSLNSLV